MPATAPDPLAPVLLDGRSLSRPLRIIQVVNVRWFNATAWYALYLSRLLRERGHQVMVLGLPGTGAFARAEEWGLSPMPLPLTSANPLTLTWLASKLAHLVGHFRPDVVNCHRGEGFVLWALLKSRHPFALVRTRGDQRPPRNNLPNRFLHGRVADAVIATNSRTAEELRRLGVPSGRLFTVLGGVDTAQFYPDPAGREAVRAGWGLGPEDFAAGILGRFDRVKGHDELMRAVARLRADGLPVRLVLAGFATNSMSEDDLRAMAGGYGLRDVLFTGRVADVRAVLNAFDAGVVASVGSEAIARAALEIMACGVPLVGTDVGVMPDLLDPAAMVPAGDAEALAACLGRAAGDGEFRAWVRQRQAERMADLSGDAFVDKTLEIYEKALAGTR